VTSDDILARYAKKVDGDLGGTALTSDVADAVRQALEGAADLGAVVRDLIGTEFRADQIRVGAGREEDLQMATAVAMQRCALSGALPLYIWSGRHWYALPASFFTSKSMWDRTSGRKEEARHVAFFSWVNELAHRADFGPGDDGSHLAVIDLALKVQTTVAGQTAALAAARALANPTAGAATTGDPAPPSAAETWRVQPGETQKVWVHRRAVTDEANRRLTAGLTAKQSVNGYLAEMAAECGVAWSQGSISTTIRTARRT
jgi:hypothetical protein